MGIRTWLWSEDVATNAGIAVIQAALDAGNRGHTLSTVDIIQAPQRETRLAFILTADETPVTAAASGTVTVTGRDRAVQLPLVKSDGTPGFLDFRSIGGLRIPKGTTLTNLGNASGAGAEQHQIALFVDDPGFPGFPMGPAGKSSVVVTMATAALTTATISGFTDVTGRTVAYTNAIRAIPDSKNIKCCLKRIGGWNAAGYGTACIRNPGQDANLVFPMVSTFPTYYDLGALFGVPGGGLLFNADEPLQIGSIGVGANACTFEMEIGIDGMDVTDLS